MFTTGASVPPPMGFETTPTIEFNDGNLPTANTCATTLHLPTIYKEYEVFKEKMDFSILNSPSFGQAWFHVGIKNISCKLLTLHTNNDFLPISQNHLIWFVEHAYFHMFVLLIDASNCFCFIYDISRIFDFFEGTVSPASSGTFSSLLHSCKRSGV